MKRYNQTRLCCSFAVLAALALPGSAGATILYTNLANPNPTNFTAVSATTWVANSFTTDNNSYQLTDVILALEGVSTTGTLTVSLYNSTTGTPAGTPTSPTTLGTIADSSLSTSMFTQQTVNGNNFMLAPNTTYFVVLSGSTVGAPDAEWERENGATGTGVAGQALGISANAGSTWNMHVINSDFQPYLMQIDASTSSPEPGTLFGAIGGLLVLLSMRLRRR